ncbi:hypothetical protein HD553DRAFT_341451 [Filobasidium floriforme]|uniref:uncharacterized protein n=1 Tax=Filobasidium floriforme TaxID=5210 RepID=UPI001E8CA7B3|nr:uncharacterized protein HD553DRAFT_341451 [Filobasidium floriforme]KAH8085662.1 hypothetical protein HD553DRAFT_341451 [Filobasidium floriforme]
MSRTPSEFQTSPNGPSGSSSQGVPAYGTHAAQQPRFPMTLPPTPSMNGSMGPPSSVSSISRAVAPSSQEERFRHLSTPSPFTSTQQRVETRYDRPFEGSQGDIRDWRSTSVISQVPNGYGVGFGAPAPSPSPAESASSSLQFNAKWLEADDRLMTEILVKSVQNGTAGDNGFNEKTWGEVATAVNAIRSQGGEKNIKSCMSRYQKLRSDYFEPLYKLATDSGLGWDPVNGWATAPEQVWEDFRTSTKWDLYDLFSITQIGRCATGAHVATPHKQTPRGAKNKAKNKRKTVEREDDADDDDEGGSEAETSQTTPSKAPKSRKKRSRTSAYADSNDSLTLIHQEMATLNEQASQAASAHRLTFEKVTEAAAILKLDHVDRNRLNYYFIKRPLEATAFLSVPDDFLEFYVERILEQEREREMGVERRQRRRTEGV